MKKLLLIAPALLASQFAYGATIYLANSGTNLNQTKPAGSGGKYYKCSNSVSFSCQTTQLEINYSSQSGGSGTESSPYILTGCSFSKCVCGHNEYLDGTKCTTCPYNTVVLTNQSQGHTSTGSSACQYCMSNMLKTSKDVAPGVYLPACESCPANGTCNGSTSVSCNYGYYGTTSCTKCPTPTDIYSDAALTKHPTPVAGPGAKAITNCAIYPQSGLHDRTGTFGISAGCMYKE